MIALAKINPAIPLRIFGTMALVGSLAAWSLPETTGVNLPETPEAAEKFAKSVTWKEMLMPFVFLKGHCCWKSGFQHHSVVEEDEKETQYKSVNDSGSEETLTFKLPLNISLRETDV